MNEPYKMVNGLKEVVLSLLGTMLENDLDDCFSFSEDELGDSCQYLYIDGNPCQCCQTRRLISAEIDEADRMAAEINRLQAENERLRDVLDGIQITAQYTAGHWAISDLTMDEIAEALGNKEEESE